MFVLSKVVLCVITGMVAAEAIIQTEAAGCCI